MAENTNPNTGPLRFKRLRLRIVILGVLVVIAFAGSSAYDAWRAYSNALAATNREITNVVRALAEQTAWTFQGIDLLLLDTARWYQNDSKKIAPERLDEVLANRSAGVRQIRLVTITDAQGIQRHRSRGSSPAHLDVSDRSYFIAQRDSTVAGLFMSEPVITRSDGVRESFCRDAWRTRRASSPVSWRLSSISRTSRNSTRRSRSGTGVPCSFCVTMVKCSCVIHRIPLHWRNGFRNSSHRARQQVG
jgi:hypothetical protein